MKQEEITKKMTAKDYTYKQFLAALIYNSDDTDPHIKEDLYKKYGDIIKL